MPKSDPVHVAAIDLGSNSFHMIIARATEHDLHVIDRLKEPVRLAAGLGKKGRLDEDAEKRALACLERFGQRLRALPSPHVRAVGTNTFRQIKGRGSFRKLASEALGRPIEIVSGQEEARLIYLGVAHSHATEAKHRLVVDIGGGSTEIIAGTGFEAVLAHSLYMGCVSYTRRHFPDDIMTRECFKKAETAAGLELQAIERPLRSAGWEAAVGASGTINAVSEILRLQGLSDGTIDLDALKKLRKLLISAKHTKSLSLEGLSTDRAQVLPGGLAILTAVFKSLRIESMGASSGALREGVVYDLLGRIRHEDVRDRTIRRMVDQYRIDERQAERVEKTTHAIMQKLAGQLSAPADSDSMLLHWAARLHEIGLVVSHTGYHRHGAYLVENSHMPGFSADDQAFIATLIRNHRRRPLLEHFAALHGDRVELALELSLVLRLAVLFNRARHAVRTPGVSVDEEWKKITLRLGESWTKDHPLTTADLEQEADYLSTLGIRLTVEIESAPKDKA